jgi:hypothetical protein
VFHNGFRTPVIKTLIGCELNKADVRKHVDQMVENRVFCNDFPTPAIKTLIGRRLNKTGVRKSFNQMV